MPSYTSRETAAMAISLIHLRGTLALALAQEKAVGAVEHYRVSPRVNNVKSRGAELIGILQRFVRQVF